MYCTENNSYYCNVENPSLCHGGGGTKIGDVRFQFQESDSLVCLVALLFLNVNLTLNFHMISVQNTSRVCTV